MAQTGTKNDGSKTTTVVQTRDAKTQAVLEDNSAPSTKSNGIAQQIPVPHTQRDPMGW